MQGSYMISLVPCKDRTRKYVMICMTSYMILVWNQGSGDPGMLGQKIDKKCFKKCISAINIQSYIDMAFQIKFVLFIPDLPEPIILMSCTFQVSQHVLVVLSVC